MNGRDGQDGQDRNNDHPRNTRKDAKGRERDPHAQSCKPRASSIEHHPQITQIPQMGESRWATGSVDEWMGGLPLHSPLATCHPPPATPEGTNHRDTESTEAARRKAGKAEDGGRRTEDGTASTPSSRPRRNPSGGISPRRSTGPTLTHEAEAPLQPPRCTASRRARERQMNNEDLTPLPSLLPQKMNK